MRLEGRTDERGELLESISAVLSGGAVVSIYSDAEYVSYGLDFIPIGLARKVDSAEQRLRESEYA